MDQGQGLTKVWSQQEKQQITKQLNKDGLNDSKSVRERRWEEERLLECDTWNKCSILFLDALASLELVLSFPPRGFLGLQFMRYLDFQ